MPQWLVEFCAWLQQSSFSQLLQNVEWIVPALQTVHILCIGAVISSALALTLRQFGLFLADQPAARVSASFLRVIWYALPVLLLTGSLLITAEPRRSFGSPAFQLKMLLLVCVISLLLVFRKRFARIAAPGTAVAGTATADAAIVPTWSSEAMAVGALLLWVCIIFAGRWIAYASGK
jgi:hypothetical protein